MDNDLVVPARKNVPLTEIVVRVDAVDEPRTFGDAKVYLKFMVANEKALRIQCMALVDQIERIRPLVRKNTIIRIKGAVSMKEPNPKVNHGDVPFILMINSSTVITVIRDYDPDDGNEENPHSNSVNESSRSPLDALIRSYELDEVTKAINNNTAAVRELTAVLRDHRQDV